ncbi:MAG: ketoacyl-ACP synthase III [Candidatus Omnitrophica bacterium]|nr:ketoacyl-ACP synthase III [Candidatus Omnitrophota bacterium]MCM8802563.1 ketoacyl-ACP synthase III [Candidatus Omnitrophota bacterium]
MGVAIIGTGSYLPYLKLTNFDLENMVDTSDEWIVTRTGIKERRICPKGKGASDLGLEASLMAIKDAGIKKDEIEFIICATITPDMYFPSTACIIQKKLGLENIPSFDFQAACSGFIYGMEIAKGLISGCGYKKGLVVATECMSRLTDYTDRSTCVLLGDGAGAAVVSENEENGIIDSYLSSNGKYENLLFTPGGVSLKPSSFETIEKRENFMKMEGSTLFKIAIYSMSESVNKVLERNKIKKEDISIVIPHQANLRIIAGVAKNLEIPIEKFFINIEKYGNMSAACIPIALDEAVKNGRIKKGDLVITVAFGAGLTWAANLIRWVK